MAAILLVLPTPAVPALTWIAISECELNGFGLGDTFDRMRQILGEPDRRSFTKPPENDFPNTEYHYDGLRIVFSMRGRSALTFFVTSDKYRLRSGIGVGSSRQDIESTLGPASEVRLGSELHLYYGLNAPGGQPVSGQLEFKMKNDVAVAMIAGWRYP